MSRAGIRPVCTRCGRAALHGSLRDCGRALDFWTAPRDECIRRQRGLGGLGRLGIASLPYGGGPHPLTGASFHPVFTPVSPRFSNLWPEQLGRPGFVPSRGPWVRSPSPAPDILARSSGGSSVDDHLLSQQRVVDAGHGAAPLRHLQLKEGGPRPRAVQPGGSARGEAGGSGRRHCQRRWATTGLLTRRTASRPANSHPMVVSFLSKVSRLVTRLPAS